MLAPLFVAEGESMKDARARMISIRRRLRFSSDEVIEAALADIADIASGKLDPDGTPRKAAAKGSADRKTRGGRDRSED